MKKNIKKIVIGLFLLLTTVACQKDWLDEQSSMQVSAEEQFETKDGFKDALMGVYIGMTDPALYGKDMTWNLVDLLSQQYATLPTNANYAGIQRFRYDTQRSSDELEALWAQGYNVIANINLVLEMIDKKKGVVGDIDYSLIKGELLTLRVFVHFDIMRLFGYGDLGERQGLMQEYSIPYVTTFNKNITPQLSYTETFQLMKNDLDQALELLKEGPVYATDKPDGYYDQVNRDGFYDNREQRMNYYAAKALQARVLQWKGKQAEAGTVAEDVINNSFTQLINSETYPIASDRIFSQEILFALDTDGFKDLINPLLDAEGDGTNYDALYYTPNFVDETFEISNVNIGIADVRYNTLMEQQSRGFAETKLLQKGLTNETYNQMPLIKLPEMYYIAAESYAKSNQLTKAIAFLNQVRSSRGILEEIPQSATKDEVLFEIKKEYKKEFLMEGQLFFYYKRTGETNIPGVSDNVTINDDIYVLPYPDQELEFGNRQ